MANEIDRALAAETPPLAPALSLRSGFKITEVPISGAQRSPITAAPSLGPLAAFVGTFTGNGFNTIFRPDSATTPTKLPIPVAPIDNILELNLTTETLSFSPSLGAVPNRGTGSQSDAFLNGVPYLQSITDITDPKLPTGIHLEPGLWMIVPSTTDPKEGVTLARMASIPHGTTIAAQGTSTTQAGPPVIPPVDMTPFTIKPPPKLIRFPSQTAGNKETRRIPQDLSSFIAAGTITQAILDDPNTILRNHIAHQKITSTTTIAIDTDPASPLFGGGTDNIAFLAGDPGTQGPNAQAISMRATFWIETVEHTIVVPPFRPGDPPLALKPEGADGRPVPEFLVRPPIAIGAPRRIVVSSVQIQYSQEVFLNFKGLSWPHISVATLVPSERLPVPDSAWA